MGTDKKISRIFKFIKVWLLSAKMAAQDQLTTSWGGYLFIFGKIVNFFFYFLFIFSVLSSSESLVGFSRDQVVLFFLIYKLVDVTSQFLFRGVYVFRWRVVRGDFDLDLVKPLPSFFRPLFAFSDILDLITLPPLIGFIFYYLSAHQLISSEINLFLFLLLFFNATLITFSVHLFVSAVGVITTEVDHLIWIWRDVFDMAKLPTDIYSPGLRLILTFIIPVIVAVTFPTKTLLGILSWPWVLFSFLVGIILTTLSLKFWRYALTKYSSASS